MANDPDQEQTLTMGEVADVELLKGLLASRRWTRRELGNMVLQAARGAHTKSFFVLMDYKAPVSSRDNCDRNALHLVLRYGGGNVDILRACLNALKPNQINSHVNCKDKKGYTPLYYAADKGYLGCLKALIAAKANLDQQSSYDKDTALMIAASKGYQDCVKLLIEAKCDVHKKNFFWYTALIMAAQRGQTRCAQALLDAGANLHAVDYSGHNALTKAAENGSVETVKVLIDNGAALNWVESTGRSALFLAAAYQHHAVVDYLVSIGADVNLANSMGFSPFLMAIKRDDLALIQKLMSHGCDVMQVYMTEGNAVHMACLNNSFKCLNFLLESEHGSKYMDTLDKMDEKGKTPLTLSCERVCVENVMSLLKHGANPDLLDNHGRSPLTCAIRGYSIFSIHVTKTIKALLRYGCNVNEKARLETAVICRHDGHNYKKSELQLPFEVAARLGQVSIAKMLWVAGSQCGKASKWADVVTTPWYNFNNFSPDNQDSDKQRQETCDFLKSISQTPQCLAQHCRTVIRQAMGNDVENKVLKLCLPETLKDFLNIPELDTIDEEFAAANQPPRDNSESEVSLSDSDMTDTTDEDSDIPGGQTDDSLEDDDDDEDDD